MSAALAERQRRLLQAIAQPRHADAIAMMAPLAATGAGTGRHWHRGLQAYRSNAHELAPRALQVAYPVVAELLGADNFKPLARQLWHGQPPACGDLAAWGGTLADSMSRWPALVQQEPFLPDVARVEWALHRAGTAADSRGDPGSLALLAQVDPTQLTLVLSPGAWTCASAYPVVSIIDAHLRGEPTLEDAGRRLRMGAAEAALVWRHGLQPRLRIAATGEIPFIAALQESRSLLDALAVAPGFDFGTWLAPAFDSGLLAGARRK